EKSEKLRNLLKLKNREGREYFYHRKISLEDELVELNCSNIDIGLVQAMDLGREYGITNSDVINVVKKNLAIFRGVLSYNLSKNSDNKDFISDLRKIEKDIKIAGTALYPSYTNLDLTDDKNTNIKELLSYCNKNQYFIKIDVGNQFMPENKAELTSYTKLKSFFSLYSENVFILSGLDISGDFNLYYQLLKSFNNVWIEIDPRTFGGMTPTDCFKQVFALKGFIQNCWHRLLIGSATPTLEISQMVRGFLEATEELSFSQKCILRTWAHRNVIRLNYPVFPSLNEAYLSRYNPILKINKDYIIENNNEIDITYIVKLRSYSITQLIFLTKLIDNLLEETLKKFPNLQNGEFFIRSFHTTTSLITNEHEYGNYLDLHYMFAESSMKNCSQFLHTVRALENRADFNHYDHEMASTYGSRQLTIPILNRKLEIGGRENYYVLVTFGPRTFNLLIQIRLIKEN
ncbi:MAG: hypothetical protein EU532_04620, partial [Promethearchaeota archaeon]